MPTIHSPSTRSRIFGWGALLIVAGIALIGHQFSTPQVDEPAPVPSPVKSRRMVKIGLLDMERIYREYHKTREYESELEKENSQAKENLDELINIWRQWRDDTVNREAAGQFIGDELLAVNESKSILTTYTTDRQAEIAERLKRMRAEILEDIHFLVQTMASKEHYDLVFDKSGKSGTGIEIILICRTGIDFTEAVISQANP